AVPGLHLALLRADMEGDAARLEPEALGEVEHLDRHLGVAAELPRQRPLGAGAVVQDAAEHLRSRRGTSDLLDLGDAVDREQANTDPEAPPHLPLLLHPI